MAVPAVWEAGPACAAFVGAVIVVMLVCLCSSWKAPEIIMFAALVTVWNANIITTSVALSGFSNTGMLAVGALFVVVAGVEKSQIADKCARYVFGVETSMRSAMIRMMLLVFALSAFFNNTPIVALFIPIVRDFCRVRGFSPSKFLMPLSFAVIGGGVITMIGTSTNLVVNGILADSGEEQLDFFAPAPIAVPVGLMGILFMFLVAPIVLPDRVGLFGFIRDRANELLTEIEITEGFPYVGSSVQAVLAKLELTPEAVIKIRRPGTEGSLKSSVNGTRKLRSVKSTAALWGTKRMGDKSEPKLGEKSMHYFNADGQYADIYPVNVVTETVHVGDVLFLSGPQNMMLKFHGNTSQTKVPGLRFLESNPIDLIGAHQEFFEVVLGDHNISIGKFISDANFGSYYNCTVLAVRPRGTVDGAGARGASTAVSHTDFAEHKEQAEAAEKAGAEVNVSFLREADIKTEVKARRLAAGDAILVLAADDFESKWGRSSDFFVISKIGKIPAQVRMWDYVPLILFAGMIAWVTSKQADMSRAAMSVGTILCLFGWVSSRKAVSYVDWGLLLLIGSALGLSKAITTSGLAGYIGDGIKSSGLSPWGSLWLVYIFVTLMTEVVTNNAAAALATPVALEIAAALGTNYKAFAMVIVISASTAFLTPIGYQTNLMVWAPGAYRFSDFARLGIGMNILYMIGTCLLIPAIYPL